MSDAKTFRESVVELLQEAARVVRSAKVALIQAELAEVKRTNAALQSRLDDYMDLAQTHDECDADRKMEDGERLAELGRLQGELDKSRSEWALLRRTFRRPEVESPEETSNTLLAIQVRQDDRIGELEAEVANLHTQRESARQTGTSTGPDPAKVTTEHLDKLQAHAYLKMGDIAWWYERPAATEAARDDIRANVSTARKAVWEEVRAHGKAMQDWGLVAWAEKMGKLDPA
jgi:hypothetical protein